MTTLPPFHLPTTPLATGVCCVEASAGTGKTFTIAGLFLRLILERDLSVNEILVVTFTEAATEELRERIRATLVDAVRVLDGLSAENPAVDEIVARALSLHGVAATVRSQAELTGVAAAAEMEKLKPSTTRKALRSRLERALRAFDEASICTIHSFCQRTLRDHAFESGAHFDTELVTDDAEILQSAVDDYWRRRFYDADPLLVSAALHRELSPEVLVRWLRLHNRHPSLLVVSAVSDRSLDELARELRAAFDAARSQWQAYHGEIRAFFTPSALWAKGDHAKPDNVAAWLEAAERCFADSGPTPEALASLKQFTPERLEKSTRAGSRTPEHEFFEHCGELFAAQSNYVTGLRLDLEPAAQDALRQRKQQMKIQFFDDLLMGLLGALRGASGPALVAEVRRKFRAALIDEFQDTDPVQWEVFRRLFGAPGAPEAGEGGREGNLEEEKEEKRGKGEKGKGVVRARAGTAPFLPFSLSPLPSVPASAAGPSLFLIGDPKQAIYGFRGADIFAYLDAARGAPEGYTLDRNWRSESGLVSAVNTLFGRAPNSFALEEIGFQKVNPAGRADEAPLQEDGEGSAPLRLWFMPREPDQKEINKRAAEESLPGLVSAEIVRLLNSNVTLGARRLTPRDIAVLVQENRQATLMQEALRRVGVPSVLHTEESVFASREARELERVLTALAQPGQERLLRAALATDLMGSSGTELDAMTRDEAAWQMLREAAHAHHERWLELGFMPMFRQWLHVGQVRRRLLEFEDGERRLTNLLHLAEVLQTAAQEHRFGPAPLARWLAERINSPDRTNEEHQLRLERDDEAVRLVTIHKSKGLEYPVVFCPFSWKSSDPIRSGEEGVLFHITPPPTLTLTPSLFEITESKSKSRRESKRETEVGRSSQFVLDLGSPQYDEHQRIAFREKLAENLRLLYVALTRAKNRCYFVWGAFRGAETSAAAWLLHRPPVLGEDWQAAMSQRFKARNDAALYRDLQQLSEGSTDNGVPTIQVERVPAATGARYQPQAPAGIELRPRRFTGVIPADWRIASFSGLVAARADELPDHDSETRPMNPEAEPPEPRSIFAFPRGTRAGTCLHQILEELDFTQSDDAELLRLVESKLRFHGISKDEFAPAVCNVVRHALATPLDASRRDFTLSRVPKSERLTELEFFLPVRELTPALLRHGMAAAGEDVAARLGALGFRPAGGFLKGFIDLVFQFEGRFYILDWKSNWLGNRVEDYNHAAMREEMVRKFYVLQAHLYVVAFHEYLRRRLPGYRYEEHFGGVRYVFLRGLDPARPEFGVYRDRPEAKAIEALAESLRNGQRAIATAGGLQRAT